MGSGFCAINGSKKEVVSVAEKYTYPAYAAWLRGELAGEGDPDFAIQVLKKVVSHIKDLEDAEEFEAAHSQPASTGHADWDRLIRAAAEMTYSHRFPGAAPVWAEERTRMPEHWFYPSRLDSWFDFNLATTPQAFRYRRICLGEGNLRTAKDAGHRWS